VRRKFRNITFDEIKKIDPVGEDVKVQQLQEGLMNKFSWLNVAFGRVYPNVKKNGDRTPEVYVGQGQYVEVFPDETVDGMCFFSFDEDYQYDENHTKYHKADVDIIFFVNLKKVFPNISHRQDAELRRDVYDYVSQFHRGWYYKGLQMGVDKVFDNFDYNFSQSIVDMQPFFVFSLSMEVTFDLRKCSD